MKVSYGYRKNHIDVYGDGYDFLGIITRNKLGRIEYSSFVGLYQFYPSRIVKSVCEETIKEINKKMKELRKIRTRREK